MTRGGPYGKMKKNETILVDLGLILTIFRYKSDCRGDIMNRINNIHGKSAADILRETGQENHIPVNLNRILWHYEISAMAMDFSDLERLLFKETSCEHDHILGAMITAPSGNTTIFYSNDSELMSSHRYRFTVAHELAHACINGEPNHIEFRHDGISNSPIEKRANIFAGELLIPLHQLETVSKKLLLPTVKSLAKVFEVSEAVMSARLKHLNRADLYI